MSDVSKQGVSYTMSRTATAVPQAAPTITEADVVRIAKRVFTEQMLMWREAKESQDVGILDDLNGDRYSRNLQTPQDRMRPAGDA